MNHNLCDIRAWVSPLQHCSFPSPKSIPDYTSKNRIGAATVNPTFSFCYRCSVHKADSNGGPAQLQNSFNHLCFLVYWITFWFCKEQNDSSFIFIPMAIKLFFCHVILYTMSTFHFILLIRYKMLFLKNTQEIEKYLPIHMTVRWRRKIGPKGNKTT